jgi:Txe/YoeB family toxin of toxin-antitoxin system
MKIVFTKTALKDLEKIKQRKALKSKVYDLLGILEKDPLQSPPFFEKLYGNLDGYYSRRINIQHRLVYTVDETKKQVTIHRMWTHYE